MGLEPYIFYFQRPLETADRMQLVKMWGFLVDISSSHKFGKITANQWLVFYLGRAVF